MIKTVGMKKRDIILNSIIKEYLKHKMPIGSNELKMKLEFNISSSTIRVYFKKLSEEGALEQLHISSGRVPTSIALQNYWKNRLEPLKKVEISDINKLKLSAKKYGIFCRVDFLDDDILKEVVNVQNRFLLLVFGKNEIVLRYSDKKEKFLKNFINYDKKELLTIASQTGFAELKEKIESSLHISPSLKEGKMLIFEMALKEESEEIFESFMSKNVFETLQNGLYFEELVPQGYMAFKQDAVIEDENANIFCLSHIHNDFENFIKLTCS